MCKVIRTSQLDKKTQELVNSLGGPGIVPVEEEIVKRKIEREEQIAWEVYLLNVDREPVEEGGMW